MTDSSEMNKIVREIDDLPTIPAVANRILGLIGRGEDTSISELGRAISADESLTAKILKISNSPFYGCQREINSVPRAIVILGLNAIKNLVMAASIKQIYKKFGLKEKLLWEHSVGCAIAAHIIAQKLTNTNIQEALSGGLLHDIGKVVLNTKDPERYHLITEKVYNDGESFMVAENEEYGFNHCDVGAMVVQKWNFSPALEQMVLFHHGVLSSHSLEPEVLEFVATVSLADYCCLKLGIGYKSPREDLNLGILPAVEILKFSSKEVEELPEIISASFENEKNLFL